MSTGSPFNYKYNYSVVVGCSINFNGDKKSNFRAHGIATSRVSIVHVAKSLLAQFQSKQSHRHQTSVVIKAVNLHFLSKNTNHKKIHETRLNETLKRGGGRGRVCLSIIMAYTTLQLHIYTFTHFLNRPRFTIMCLTYYYYII